MNRLFSGIAVLGLISSASVMAAGDDELWEMTTKLDMPGMAMPSMTQSICLPKGGAYTPENVKQQNCEMTDLKTSGDRTSWKMHCSGKDAMEGSGEVTRSANTMKGTIKMSMKGMQMNQVVSGKLVGTCQGK